MKVIGDMHTHTKFSADGQDTMEDMCMSAVKKGLSYICFTDHIDNNPNDHGFNFFDYEKYSESIEKVREKFGDKIKILKGIEFSEPHQYQRQFEMVQNKDFDVIMAGIHYLGDTYVGDKINCSGYTTDKVFFEYYNEVLKAVKSGGFNVLAHFDLPKRYLKKKSIQRELIQEIFDEIINKGIAVEVNTSSLRRGFNESLPDSELLCTYLEQGGERITTGSDAHCCNDIAADFEYSYKLINAVGGKVGVFINREFVTI